MDRDRRAEQLHAIARGYVTEGFGKKNFDAIPYHEHVELRAPLCPGGVAAPLMGREALRTVWWAPDPCAGGRARDRHVRQRRPDGLGRRIPSDDC
jgi:hypothetical protein